jgi:hypothetical protein
MEWEQNLIDYERVDKSVGTKAGKKIFLWLPLFKELGETRVAQFECVDKSFREHIEWVKEKKTFPNWGCELW